MARVCQADNCNTAVWGTCKITRVGYCKMHQSLRKDFNTKSIAQRAQEKLNAQPKTKHKLSTTQASSIRSLSSRVVVDKSKVVGSKSELLRQADKLFADFIKRRDTHNGKIACPCCNITFDADKVDSDGNKVANCMHFCDRDIYSLRFDEDAAAAGHSSCNRNQHFAPFGKEYQNFKAHLINKFGEEAVAEMELQKRKINKMDTQMLKNVIEFYSNPIL